MASVFDELAYFTPPRMQVRVDYYRLNDEPLVPYVYNEPSDRCKAVRLEGDWGVLRDCRAELAQEIADAIEGVIATHVKKLEHKEI